MYLLASYTFAGRPGLFPGLRPPWATEGRKIDRQLRGRIYLSIFPKVWPVGVPMAPEGPTSLPKGGALSVPPYATQHRFRAANRTSGPYFGRILIGKASKSALRPASRKVDFEALPTTIQNLRNVR